MTKTIQRHRWSRSDRPRRDVGLACRDGLGGPFTEQGVSVTVCGQDESTASSSDREYAERACRCDYWSGLLMRTAWSWRIRKSERVPVTVRGWVIVPVCPSASHVAVMVWVTVML